MSENFAPILHAGGDCPVAPTTPVRPVYRGKEDKAKGVRIKIAPAARLDWSHDGGPDDIIAFRVAHTPSIEQASS